MRVTGTAGSFSLFSLQGTPTRIPSDFPAIQPLSHVTLSDSQPKPLHSRRYSKETAANAVPEEFRFTGDVKVYFRIHADTEVRTDMM